VAENVAAARTDRRVRRTRAAVLEALTELILEKGYESVTVSDIIARADIGRSTFYAHFTDKRDVFDDLISDLAELLTVDESSAGGGVFAFSLPLFEHIVEQRAVISALFGPNGQSAAWAVTSKTLGAVIADELRGRPRASEVGPEQLSLVVDFVVGGFTSIIAHWIAGKRRYTAAELDAAFRGLVVPGVERTLG
jgi:AcrR family transcriptional regulator